MKKIFLKLDQLKFNFCKEFKNFYVSFHYAIYYFCGWKLSQLSLCVFKWWYLLINEQLLITSHIKSTTKEKFYCLCPWDDIKFLNVKDQRCYCCCWYVDFITQRYNFLSLQHSVENDYFLSPDIGMRKIQTKTICVDSYG